MKGYRRPPRGQALGKSVWRSGSGVWREREVKFIGIRLTGELLTLSTKTFVTFGKGRCTSTLHIADTVDHPPPAYLSR